MPIHMRLPKLKGFRNRFRVEYQVVNVGDLARLFPNGGTVGPDELVAEAVGREALQAALAALPERQRQVLILRFGLGAGTPRTLEEVGAVMGISRERARQLERATLAALRRPEIRACLEDLAS